MRMERMREYLEKREFKVETEYNPLGHIWDFKIIKSGVEATDVFACAPSERDTEELDKRQREFLENLIDRWRRNSNLCSTCVRKGTRCASIWKLSECPSYAEDLDAKPHQYEIKTTNPYGNYDAQLRAYEFLQKEFHMNKHDVKNALVESAVRNMTGTLQINGARVPVRLTSLSETTGELPKIECDVLTPTKEMQQEEYCRQDVEMTHHIYGMIKHKHAEEAARMAAKRMLNSVYGTKGWRGPEIKDVIFNPPATIVFWKDGTKTVVKAWGEDYDPEKGLAMAIAKKALGNNHDYYNTFKKWLKKAPKQEEKPADTRTLIGKVCNVESTPDGLYARVGLNSTVEANKLIQAIENGQVASFEIVADGDV